MNQDFQTPSSGEAEERQGQEPQSRQTPGQSFPSQREETPAAPAAPAAGKTEQTGFSKPAQEPAPKYESNILKSGAPKIKKPDKKKLLIGIIAAVIIVLVGFTIVLAAKIWDPPWNPFSPNPDKILNQALENMSELDTYHSKIEFKMDFSDTGAGLSAITMTAEGDSDSTDKDNPKSQIDFTVKAQVPDTPVELVFGAGMLVANDVLYFRFTNIPFMLTAYTSQLGIDITQWQNKWFYFDPEELGVSVSGLGLSSADRESLQQDLEELYFDEPVLKPVKRLGEEEIDGKTAYHFLLTLDKENLKQFLVELPSTLEEYDTLQSQGFSDEEKEEMFADIDRFFEEAGGLEFDIFIGKADKLIYEISGRDNIPAGLLQEAEQGDVDFSFSAEFSAFNEPVAISAPAESSSIIEILMGMLGMFMMEQPGGGYQLPLE